jgi:hypothetical protein
MPKNEDALLKLIEAQGSRVDALRKQHELEICALLVAHGFEPLRVTFMDYERAKGKRLQMMSLPGVGMLYEAVDADA